VHRRRGAGLSPGVRHRPAAAGQRGHARRLLRLSENLGRKQPDRNIDHRRVPNLETFFRRKGAALDVVDDPKAYHPGDLVTQRLPGNLPHIAIVTDRMTPDGQRPLVVHNIGAGARVEDTLFAFRLNGHFRFPPNA